MKTLLMALIGTVCWGIAPVFGKMGLRRIDPVEGLCLRTLIAAGLVFSWLVITGRISQISLIPRRSLLLIGFEGILATLLGDLAYYAAIKWGSVTEVSLVMSTSPLITLSFALVFLGEEITWPRLAGAIFIVIGLLLINGPRR